MFGTLLVLTVAFLPVFALEGEEGRLFRPLALAKTARARQPFEAHRRDYPKTLGVRTSLGRFALEPAWAGQLAGALVYAGARTWLKLPGFARGNRRAIDRLKRFYRDRDRFALVVTVESGRRTMQMRLAGRHQADVTADGAVAIARALVDGEAAEAGVWLPEQAVSHDKFFTELGAMGWTPTTVRR